MLALLEAAQQVTISAPALPRKADGSYPELIKGVRVERIVDISVTKKGVLFIRYATETGRGCSFVSWVKFRQALEEIQKPRWEEKLKAKIDFVAIGHILFGENNDKERCIKLSRTRR